MARKEGVPSASSPGGAASIALHRKLGFAEVGTFHEYGIKNGRYLSSL